MDSDKYYTDLLERQSKELIAKLSNERDKLQGDLMKHREEAHEMETTLTRERDEAREHLAIHQKLGAAGIMRNADLSRALDEAARQLDAALGREAKLREALESIRDMPEYDQDDIYRLRHKALAALSATSAEVANL